MTISKSIIVLTSMLLLMACGGKKELKIEEAIRPVKFSKVVQGGGHKTKIFNGISKSGLETKLSFRANGLIIQMNVDVGQKVEKGELLAKLDQKDIALNYEKAKAQVTSAQIELNTAQSNLARAKELYQSNSSSLSDYELAKNKYANANSAFKTAKKSLSLEASQFEYSKIVAPTRGIISEKLYDVNEFTQAGSSVFIMHSQEGDLEVNVGIPEKYISKIHSGAEVEVLISSQILTGIISEVGFSTGESSTYPITIKLVDPSEDLRPDMPAEITFEFGSEESKSGLIVPIKAVGEDEEGNFVFLLISGEDENYIVKKQPINLGELSNEGFIVRSGLKKNDIVATAGLRTLHDDMLVSLMN